MRSHAALVSALAASVAMHLRARPPLVPAVRHRGIARMAEQGLLRLDKLLAERDAGSRKDVDRLIRNGLVELDGEIVGKSGAKV
jgi:hypothetical protein